ncbi:MAG: DUF6282 family protein [Thermodesulfobacteriota bacterium]
MERMNVAGAIDLHIHTNPDLIDRIGDDRDIVRNALAAGMLGVQLKGHSEPTVSRAILMRKEFPGIHVFGGIVLNRYVGGINPYAVETALKKGGKSVWMPTVDANYHAKKYGRTGRYTVQELDAKGSEVGITILDEDGRLIEAVFEVLDLVSQFDAVLGTCHLSPEEIVKLIDAARARKVQKILLTHPFVKVPGVTIEFLQTVIPKGVIAEFGYCTISPMWADAKIDYVRDAIKTLGAGNCVIMSDTGQIHNAWPHEALRIFAQSLYEKGVTQKELETMMIANPRQLMGI